jgi:hypothetical protein
VSTTPGFCSISTRTFVAPAGSMQAAGMLHARFIIVLQANRKDIIDIFSFFIVLGINLLHKFAT